MRRRISKVPWTRGGRYSLADHIEYANNPNPPTDGLGFDFSALFNSAASVANTTIDTVAKARALKKPPAPTAPGRAYPATIKPAPRPAAPVLKKTATPLWVWLSLGLGAVVAGGVVISTLRQR